MVVNEEHLLKGKTFREIVENAIGQHVLLVMLGEEIHKAHIMFVGEFYM